MADRLTALAALAALGLAPAAAAAQVLECAFTTECYEDEPCAEAAWGWSVDTEAVEPGGIVTIETEAGDVAAVILPSETGLRILQSQSEGAAQLVTIAPDGSARHSVHFLEGPVVVTYLGTCAER